MKNTILSIFVLLFNIGIFSQESEKTNHLPNSQTPNIDIPPGEIRNIAEFEPVEGVLIAYHEGFVVDFNLISAMSQITTVTTIVENEELKDQIIADYQNNNVNIDNCNFLIKPTNASWTRDYGPWYISYGDDKIGIVDFIYNQPCPNDDMINQYLADTLGIEWFEMNLIAVGGNYMTDGTGIGFSTDLITDENPTLSNEEIDQLMHDYLGINTYEKLYDPTGDELRHIDCWAKLLSPDKYLVRSVPKIHPRYDEIEAVASYLKNLISGYGTPYKIIRIYTPGNEPYTNSLILNDHVFVPVTGSQWDDKAIETYQNAMPGYTVVPISGNWFSNDALHCRTHELTDRQMLYIKHIPLLGEQTIQSGYTIDAELTAYSGAEINDAQVKVFFKKNDDDWQNIAMTHTTGKNYTAYIPGDTNGTKISYYIYAEDNNTNVRKHPYIGAPDPHIFYVGQQPLPEINISSDTIKFALAQNQTGTYNFNIQNTGEAVLHIDFSLNSTTEDTYVMEISDSPSGWQNNTYSETGWEDFIMDTSGILGKISLNFNWIAEQYPENGSLHLKSPEGNAFQIAAGINSGLYTITTEEFTGEEINGDWQLWLEDNSGNGGFYMTSITIYFSQLSTLPENWVSITNNTITINPLENYELPITFNSNNMEEGEYTATLTLTTNEINNSVLEIPIIFTVDNSTGFTTNKTQKKVTISNPFTSQLSIHYSGIDHPYYFITDISGKKICEGYLNSSNNLNTVNWKKSIYLLNIKGMNAQKLLRR